MAAIEIVFIFAIALGASLGSFVALLADRFPRGESPLAPASHCDACGTPVRPRDNVPILAWFVLRGRCRYCRAFIPLRGLLLELAGAAGGWAVAAHFTHFLQ